MKRFCFIFIIQSDYYLECLFVKFISGQILINNFLLLKMIAISYHCKNIQFKEIVLVKLRRELFLNLVFEAKNEDH